MKVSNYPSCPDVTSGHPELYVETQNFASLLDSGFRWNDAKRMLDINQILEILPQRYPFVFIDRVTEFEEGRKVTAIKNVSINDWFFSGHFPGNPVMPGTLIIEAMAQTSIILYYSAYKDELNKKPDYYLGSVKVDFKHPVVPGDQLVLEAEAVKLLPQGAFIAVKAMVKDKIVSEAELSFAVKR